MNGGSCSIFERYNLHKSRFLVFVVFAVFALLRYLSRFEALGNFITGIIAVSPFLLLIAFFVWIYFKDRENHALYKTMLECDVFLKLAFKLSASLLILFIVFFPGAWKPLLKFLDVFRRLFSLETYFLFASYAAVIITAFGLILFFIRLYQIGQGTYQKTFNQLVKKSLYSTFFTLLAILALSVATYPQAYYPVTDAVSDGIFTVSQGSIALAKLSGADLQKADSLFGLAKNAINKTSSNLSGEITSTRSNLLTTIATSKDTLAQSIADTSQNLSASINEKVSVEGGDIEGDLTIQDSDLVVEGTATTEDVIPRDNLTYDLGESGNAWNNLHIHRLVGASSISLADSLIPDSTAVDLGSAASHFGTIYADALIGVTGSQWTTSGDDIYYSLGNVGIGTASPDVALDVIGSGRFTTGIKDNAVTPLLSIDADARKLYASNGSTLGLNYSLAYALSSGGAGTPVSGSNFFGDDAGNGATNAHNSNFFGERAGMDATNASYSNFIGDYAGDGATNASYSNFIGDTAGYNATHASYSNFIGDNAGYGATRAQFSNFFGNDAGRYATNASYSNFIGDYAGQGATNAGDSNFIGDNAGYGATNAPYSNFIGTNAGSGATHADDSNFIGDGAGQGATDAHYSNFYGIEAGKNAINAVDSNFIGDEAGNSATNASYSNFIGLNAGRDATNASYSNFYGRNAGYGATNAKESIFLGTFAGYSDTVDNVTANPAGTSIAIGRYSGTGGFSNSIAIGHGVINSAALQANIGNVLYLTGIYNSDTQSSTPTASGNVGIGTTNPGGGTGSSVLTLANSSAAPTALANTTHLYSSAGEGYWMDAAGNAALQTPHDLQTGKWIFSSTNVNTERTLRVEMEDLTKELDTILGGGYVFENGEAVYQGENILAGIDARLSEQGTIVSDLTLKTSENITTLSELQKSVDENLEKIYNSQSASWRTISNEFSKLNDKITDINQRLTIYDSQLTSHEARTKTQEDLAATLQAQLEELKASIATPVDIAQLDLNTQDIAYLKSLLGIGRVKNPEDVDILGRLSAETTETGALVIKIVDEDKATIGTAEIKDGEKEIFVETKAVADNSKIFITPQSEKALEFPLTITKKISGEGFTVEIPDVASGDIEFDWWIVKSR